MTTPTDTDTISGRCIDRAEIATEIRERTDLTLSEIGEMVDRSPEWVQQEVWRASR